MKQEDVAKLVGVSLNTVSLWERDVREPDTTHNLKELRKIRNFTQEKLAESIGINLRQLARIEAGESFVSSDTLLKICTALETTPKSLIQGGTGSFSSELAQPDVLPDKYESGTPNVSGIAGLNEGVKFVLNKGISNIRAHETDLAQRLYNGLSKNSRVILYTEPPSSGGHAPVISFNIEGMDSEEVAETLNQRFNIAVRAGLHCAPLAHQSLGTAESGTVRAVMSVFNSAPQIDYFLNSVNKIATLTSKKVAIDT